MKTIMRAILGMSPLNPDGKVTKGQLITDSMQASSYFDPASMPFPYTTMSTSGSNLHSAVLLAATGAAGTVSDMHGKERIMLSVFNVIRAYVEMVANNTNDPRTVIEAAGMTASMSAGLTPVSELTLAAIGNGMVQVSVPRLAGETAFIYQYSNDAGATWQEFECSKLASVQLKNQTPASILSFRFAAIGKMKGAFSASKNVIVL